MRKKIFLAVVASALFAPAAFAQAPAANEAVPPGSAAIEFDLTGVRSIIVDITGRNVGLTFDRNLLGKRRVEVTGTLKQGDVDNFFLRLQRDLRRQGIQIDRDSLKIEPR